MGEGLRSDSGSGIGNGIELVFIRHALRRDPQQRPGAACTRDYARLREIISR